MCAIGIEINCMDCIK